MPRSPCNAFSRLSFFLMPVALNPFHPNTAVVGLEFVY
jgi:hypothetical protein